MVPLRATSSKPRRGRETFAAAWSVASGTKRLVKTAPPRPRPATHPPLAPRPHVRTTAVRVCYEDGLPWPARPRAELAVAAPAFPVHSLAGQFRRHLPRLRGGDGDARRLPALAEPHRLALEAPPSTTCSAAAPSGSLGPAHLHPRPRAASRSCARRQPLVHLQRGPRRRIRAARACCSIACIASAPRSTERCPRARS